MFGGKPWVEEAELGMGIWITSPLGGVVRVLRPREIDGRVADFLLGRFVEVLEQQGPPPWVLLLDWSRATGYTSEARARLTTWCLDNRRKIARAAVILPESAPTMLKMGVTVGSTVLRAAGVELHVETGLLEASLAARVREAARTP